MTSHFSSKPPADGWLASAPQWIAALGEDGDFTRRHVLDAPMLERVRRSRARLALDVGCGEGRFCRKLQPLGVKSYGIDPTAPLLDHARRLDTNGDYREAAAEALPFAAGTFDLVVSYLSLVDIADYRAAIGEMARVLTPGGRLLIANLTSFNTATLPPPGGSSPDGRVDRYLDQWSAWAEWDDIRVLNHHRPLSAYMQALIGEGLHLVHFDEPEPTGGAPERMARYRRAPWAFLMEWIKPGGPEAP